MRTVKWLLGLDTNTNIAYYDLTLDGEKVGLKLSPEFIEDIVFSGFVDGLMGIENPKHFTRDEAKEEVTEMMRQEMTKKRIADPEIEEALRQLETIL